LERRQPIGVGENLGDVLGIAARRWITWRNRTVHTFDEVVDLGAVVVDPGRNGRKSQRESVDDVQSDESWHEL